MMKEISKIGVIILPIILIACVYGIISFIVQPNAIIALPQNGKMIMNPIVMHIHPLFSFYVNGAPAIIPAQFGIDAALWKDHSLDEFGMESMPEMNMSAMAPLHTHDDSGIVHVESTVNRKYTLGEFLNTWGLNLDGKTVKVTINGNMMTDFREHILSDGEKIRLEVQ
jgi:hypothetical protein